MVRERRKRVCVVGGGVGGLACALDLARADFDVVVLERGATPGGKMSVTSVGGAPVDAGPTVLTMRWVFEELFRDAGTELAAHVQLERAGVLARHAWPDGTRLDLFDDRARTADAIGATFGRAAADGYRAFMDDGERIYDRVLDPFLRSQRPTFATILKHGASLTRIDPFRSMWAAISQRFVDPRLRQLFGRYATYCGSSPFEAPATLGLISFVEASGVYRVRGGMRALARGLAGLVEARGGTIRTRAEVTRLDVRSGRIHGVVVDGELLEADAVVFNGDVSALGSGALGDAAARGIKPTAPRDRSLSAVTFALVGRASGFPLVHHNVFFSSDYAAEFEALLGQRRLPDAPTVYLCAQERGDQDEPKDDEAMLLVVNAPATGDEPERWPSTERKRCETTTFEAMRACGLTLSPRAMHQTTPVELARRYPGSGGALYGPIARGAFSSLARHGASSKTRGLYLAGGSVHPGPGVPMAALSGRLAAAQILEDFASTKRSRTAATAGITSTQ